MLAVTQTHALVFGAEVSFGSIAGPFDALDAYADSSASPKATIEWRIYATVAGVVSLVVKGLAGGSTPKIVQWAPVGTAPALAEGDTYELRAYWAEQGAAPAAVKATLVGYNATDVVGNSSGASTQALPAGFGEVTFATLNGYAQYADAWSRRARSAIARTSRAKASVVQTDVQGGVTFTLYALSAVGGVEAADAAQDLVQKDGTTRIFARIPLPGAVQYRLAAKGKSADAFGLQIEASLAVYSESHTSAGTTTPNIGWSVVDVFSGAYGPASVAGDQTSGTYFAVQALVTFTGVRTYWAGGATTLKAALWNFAGGVQLATGNLAVPGPGVYVIPFAVSYTLPATLLAHELAVSVYDTAGAAGHYTKVAIGSPDPNTVPARPFMAGPVFSWASWSAWAPGDAFPTDIAAAEMYPVEPVFTMPA